MEEEKDGQRREDEEKEETRSRLEETHRGEKIGKLKFCHYEPKTIVAPIYPQKSQYIYYSIFG